MKRMNADSLRKRNIRALGVVLAALAVFIVLLSLPVYRFSTDLYVKKSSNTFVGDEKYIAARAEVDAAAEDYQSGGVYGDVQVTETITERVNSKGETTSLIAFHVIGTVSRTGWSFIQSGLPAGKLLVWMLAAVLLAVGMLAVTLPGTLSQNPSRLSKRISLLRQAACALALFAMLLVPVFNFYTVSMFQRQIINQLSQEMTPRLTALIASANAFLYNGQTANDAAQLLEGLTQQALPTLWIMLPALFALLVGMILLTKESLKHTLARGALYAAVVVMCVIILYPYYVMLITAFRDNAETTDMHFTYIFPTHWVWSNITDIIHRNVLRFLSNSMLLSVGATMLSLACGIPAAYAMARMRFRGKSAFLGFVIISQMFAPIVLLVGISQLMNFLHLSDTIWGLILINAAFNQAFAIWLMYGTFSAISPEMEQAASIDGCSIGGALWNVLLPMAAPGIVTTLIFVFINSWNEYTISTVLISTPIKKPITVGITQFSSFNMIEWQYLFASALLATIPVVILFMLIEKHLVAGLTSGGVKG
ncbi:MAG TPA: carbohydrate ABC transporter permease [Candidatus Limiplasma sp.]|nr:carbohydrate ABC transporter permease [Candidatus Limiplasma sp.]